MPPTSSNLPAAPRNVREAAVRSKEASRKLPFLSSEVKDRALSAMAAALRTDAASILAANARDLSAADARTGTDAMAPAMRRRLSLDAAKIEGMAAALEE